MQANPSFRAKMPSCISWMSSTRYKYPADNCCLTNASLFALVAVMKPYQTPWAATYAVDSSWNTWKIMEHVVLSTNPPRIRQFFSLNCNPWHLMAILRLKRYRKMSLMSPWGMHQMCKPKAKAWRDKKKVQQLSVSFGEFSLVLHIDSAEKTSWNCWNCRNANVQGFCPTVSAKKCHESNSLQSRRCSARFAKLLPTFSRHLGAFIHPSMPGTPRLQTRCDFFLNWWTIKNLHPRQATSLGQGTVMLLHLAEVKVIEVAGIWCWCILSG